MLALRLGWSLRALASGVPKRSHLRAPRCEGKLAPSRLQGAEKEPTVMADASGSATDSGYLPDSSRPGTRGRRAGLEAAWMPSGEGAPRRPGGGSGRVMRPPR